MPDKLLPSVPDSFYLTPHAWELEEDSSKNNSNLTNNSKSYTPNRGRNHGKGHSILDRLGEKLKLNRRIYFEATRQERAAKDNFRNA